MNKDNPMQDNSDIVVAAAKVAPPAAVSAMAASGISLSDILMTLTIIYTLAQCFFLIRDKWYRDPWRKRKDEEDKEEDNGR